ncbi:chromodomain Y-like protein [Aplochiton taeniatus]
MSKWKSINVMATAELYEVERIMDKRKNKQGKTEYLVRWRGYGNEGDTWEPETHLSSCMVFIHEFNRQNSQRQKVKTLLRSTRRFPSTAIGHCPINNALKHVFSPSSTLPHTSLSKHQQTQFLYWDDSDNKTDSENLAGSERVGQSTGGVTSNKGLSKAFTIGNLRQNIDLAKSGIKILVPKSQMSSHVESDVFSSEAPHILGEAAGQGSLEVALLKMPIEMLLGPGEERARIGTRPRTQSLSPLYPQKIPATVRTLNGKGTSTIMEAFATNGMINLQSAVAGATCTSAVSGKRRLEDHSSFDKRLRFSVRQTESAYRYRDIIVKKQDGFTHILLSTKSSENNSLNPEVMKEIQSAMTTAATDDSKVVLLSAVGSVFCYGLDYVYFIRQLTDDRKKESIKMAETIRTFVNTFVQFKKPIIVAVNGPAVGLGAAILPLCDIVWANEKAWFQTPYTMYGQTPDACSSLTFSNIMGVASANEMLLGGRKLTAQEACAKGLVSQVLWPGTFTQEVMLRIRELVSCNSDVLRESKALMRNTNRAALEQANERECEVLKRVWGSLQGTDSILIYLQKNIEKF